MSLVKRNISIHLQDFPSIDFIEDDHNLIQQMDLVRNICSQALSIRDHLNLRVRLPLASLTIIGKNSQQFLDFKDIIADEVNVKQINILEDIGQYGEIKLQINFKKIGSKYGSKIKEITQSMKQGDWQKINDNKISIAGVELIDDEFELKLNPKNFDDKKYAINALASNDYLIMLDIVITDDLIDEGIARDIVRSIQQNRKNANLDISQKINVKLFSTQERISKVGKAYASYIANQVLAKEVEIIKNKTVDNSYLVFENVLDDGDLFVAFKNV